MCAYRELCAGAMVARAMGGRVIPGTGNGTRSPAVGAGTTLWLWVGDGRVVVLVAFPLRRTVGVRGVGEILVGVGQIELEECGGVVGEWTGGEEGDVADGMDGARGRGGGHVGAGVRRGRGDCMARLARARKEGNGAQSKKETGGKGGGSGSHWGRKLSRGERRWAGRKRSMVGGSGRGDDHGE